ncbi:MAG: hypothetical protein IJ669_03825 [Prevotella sp.]|nr:hypothetical protein [Prevotella sp.]
MNEVFVLELPLRVEKYQADILNKRYEQLRQLYNYVQGKLLRQYRYFEQMAEFQACKTFKEKHDFFRSHPFHIKGVYGKNKDLLDITFDEYGINGFVAKLGKKLVSSNTTYADLGITSTILDRLSLAVWASWEKMLYSFQTKRLSFKKYSELDSLSNRRIVVKGRVCFPGMELHLEKMELAIKLNSKTGKNAKFIILSILHNPKHEDYEMYALKGGIDSIKVLTVVRRMVRGRYKYYLQLSIEGEKPLKGRALGKGNVGIDLGPTTVAISSESIVTIDKLAPKCDNIDAEKAKLGRKIDRSRRANNPDNFNEDGTIKRGVRLTWNDSKRYKALRKEMSELQRRQAAIRKQQHIDRANDLLKEGDTFIVENNPIKGWAARAKETKIDEKTGRFKSKKGRGKSIGNHAPAMFVTILENKVKSLGGKVVKVDTKNAASRYDFTDESFTDHGYDRKITLSNGDTHQRDMLAAFNLQHLKYDEAEKKQYDREAMAQDYDRFCELEQAEIMRYKTKEKKDDRSTIGAEDL